VCLSADPQVGLGLPVGNAPHSDGVWRIARDSSIYAEEIFNSAVPSQPADLKLPFGSHMSVKERAILDHVHPGFQEFGR
jgi:hypothetical protein